MNFDAQVVNTTHPVSYSDQKQMMLKCSDAAIKLFATAETKKYAFGTVTVVISFKAKRSVKLTQSPMPTLSKLTEFLDTCITIKKVSPAALNSIKQAQTLHGTALVKDSFSNQCIKCMVRFP